MGKQVKLIMVTGENNNKFYNMTENGSNFDVEYGRVQKTSIKEVYPMDMWDKKYKEKIKKGYKDVTAIFAEVVTADPATGKAAKLADISNSQVKQLMDTLQAYANKSIKQNYTVSADAVTQAQVDEAQAALDKLAAEIKIGAKKDAVNKHLLELFMIVPRQMSNVKNHILDADVKTQKDLEVALNKLAAEQATLDVMAGQVAQLRATKKALDPKEAKKTTTMLEVMGLEVEPITDKATIDLIKSKMNDLTIGGRQDNSKIFKQAFRVVNKRTQATFDAHLAKAKNKRCELLWHGSRNANYLSIAEKGLLIRPAGAGYNGSMFDDGVYFARHSGKSLNYTDYAGSYRSYTGGNASQAFLLLYNVHVGKPLDIHRHDSSCYTISKKVKADGFDCLWAHAGQSLAYDEIIIYNSNQCTVQYLIEVQ